jgi:hypothetical protein
MGGLRERLATESRSRHQRTALLARIVDHLASTNMMTRPKRSDDANAFIPDPAEGPAHVDDDLAENLAEEFIVAATSAEEPSEDVRDEVLTEELGGPFLEVPAVEEFDRETDASNPPGADREPFPRAVRAPYGK